MTAVELHHEDFCWCMFGSKSDIQIFSLLYNQQHLALLIQEAQTLELLNELQCSLCRFGLWCIVESMSCEVQQMSEYRCVAGLWPWNNAVGRAFGLTISQ